MLLLHLIRVVPKTRQGITIIVLQHLQCVRCLVLCCLNPGRVGIMMTGNGCRPYSCRAAIASCHYRSSGGGVAATASCCWNIMVVFSLVSGDHCPQIVGSPFHVFTDRTSIERAFVVAPATINKIRYGFSFTTLCELSVVYIPELNLYVTAG